MPFACIFGCDSQTKTKKTVALHCSHLWWVLHATTTTIIQVSKRRSVVYNKQGLLTKKRMKERKENRNDKCECMNELIK